jgi:hypothetical protein
VRKYAPKTAYPVSTTFAILCHSVVGGGTVVAFVGERSIILVNVRQRGRPAFAISI